MAHRQHFYAIIIIRNIQVHDCVRHIKTLPEVRIEYMTLGDYIDYERKDAAREAIEEGKEMAGAKVEVKAYSRGGERCGYKHP